MTAALIPCRKGSKSIPNKNFRLLKGKPLYQWTLDTALKAKLFDKIILSSDGGLEGVEGTDVIIVDNNRSAELSDDKASLDAVMCYYLNEYPEIKQWCLLQPTSPLRHWKDIRKAHKMLQNSKYDSVVSVTPGTCMYWLKDAVDIMDKPHSIATYHIHARQNRQQRMKEWFQENGAIYFTNRYTLEYEGCRLGGTIGLCVMPKERSFEIDDELDWRIVEMMLGKK